MKVNGIMVNVMVLVFIPMPIKIVMKVNLTVVRCLDMGSIISIMGIP